MFKTIIFVTLATMSLSIYECSSTAKILPEKNVNIVYSDEKTQMQCRFSELDQEKGEKCFLQIGTIGLKTSNDERLAFRWTSQSGKIAIFIGTRGFADEWRFGELNSKPAAAYGINRRHHIFSTVDYKQRFEYWYEGWK
jgi:hypothetical protein